MITPVCFIFLLPISFISQSCNEAKRALLCNFCKLATIVREFPESNKMFQVGKDSRVLDLFNADEGGRFAGLDLLQTQDRLEQDCLYATVHGCIY